MAMFNKFGIEGLWNRPFCPGITDLSKNIARIIKWRPLPNHRIRWRSLFL